MARPAIHFVLPAAPANIWQQVISMMRIVRMAGLPAGGLLLITCVAVGFGLAGLIRDTPLATSITAFTLLVVGVPHGSFDLALLRRAGATGSTAYLVLVYVGCAAAMYTIWQIAPTLALATFLFMAVVHFAEDWADCGSRFIATGIAAAIVAAPALLHGTRLGELFVVLTDDTGAAMLADVLLLVGPVAIAIAVLGIGLLWQAGCRDRAISAGCGLAAMLLLPPVPGFALFFCLVHSPMQFRGHAHTLGLRGFRNWRGIVVPISLGGLTVAGIIYVLNNGVSITASVFAVSFMTLSVLTVPHMLVPVLVNRLQGLHRLLST